MYNVVSDISTDMDMLAFGRPHPNMVRFMQSTMMDPSQMLTETARSFYQNAMQVHENLVGHDAMRRLKAATRKLSNMFMPNDIREYTNIGQIQQAQDRMRRLIMAEPTTRELYHRQLIDGYSGYYFDSAPHAIGDTHHEYQQVTDGIFMEDEEGYDTFTIYYGEQSSDEMELLHEEQVDVLRVWDRVKYMLAQGKEDPTSPTNALL